MEKGKNKRGAPPKGPNTIRFELSEAQAGFVGILIRKGTYGETALDVVKSLFNRQLQTLQREEILPQEAQFGELHSLPLQNLTLDKTVDSPKILNSQQKG
jgi:hypothetical protein